MKNYRGLSLLEALISCALLTISLSSIVLLELKLTKITMANQQHFFATREAESLIEEFRKSIMTSSRGGQSQYQAIQSGSDNVQTDGTIYYRKWDIKSNKLTDYKIVSVYVSWLDNFNQNHEINLSSIINPFKVSAVANQAPTNPNRIYPRTRRR